MGDWDGMGDANKIRDAADAVKGVVEAVPVYQDLAQPAAQEVGKALQTVAKTIHVVLAPISALVRGYDTIKDVVSTRVAQKLQSVPPEKIQTPEPHVVGPVLEALRYTGHQESLREMYANLLATSLDVDTCKYAHPSFVDIIKGMSPDEAKIMRLFATSSRFPVIDVRAGNTGESTYQTIVRNFSFIGREAGCDHPVLTQSYLDNMVRFGLLRFPSQEGMGAPLMAAPNTYEPLENASELADVKAKIDADENLAVEFGRSYVEVTTFGKQFCQACVIEKGLLESR